MGDITIITANMGGYDTPRPQAKQDESVEWRYYYDDETPAPPEPWEGIGGWKHGADTNLAAKSFKCTPPVDTRYAIWIDANMEITSPLFAMQAVMALSDGKGALRPHPVAVFRHPRRDCIYDEADASIGAESQGGKYDPVQIGAQYRHYYDEGYPAHAGLYACGVVAWDLAQPVSATLGAAWFQDCARWSVQDQLSFPVVCRRLGVQPGVFPFEQIEHRLSRGMPYLANRWLRIWPHGPVRVSP